MNFSKKNHKHKSGKKTSVSRKIRIMMLCLITTFGFAQQKMNKVSKSIKVDKDVTVDLNTSYVEIEIETWNKDMVEVEAFIESKKLSKAELKEALESWNLKVEGGDSKVVISSQGSSSFHTIGVGDYVGILKDMEIELADLPEIPRMPEMPAMPKMAKFPDMPEIPEVPEMPEMPELPELPDGIRTISFDYEKYQKEGESYLSDWSKKYEKEGGKELQKRMEDWARRFAESGYQEKMEKWGEEYGKRFEGKWAKDMEKWGEKFGKNFGEKYAKDMEKWGEEFGEKFGEEWAEKMEAWGERFGEKMEKRSKIIADRSEAMSKRAEERAKYLAERTERMSERRQAMAERREGILHRRLESGSNSEVRKVIRIKIPKKAKLKTNIRHGEMKIGSVIYGMKGDISHSFLVAEHIDGRDTSINVSYSPVIINTWSLGSLNLNFVDKAQIKSANNIVLNSKSSNITIENITDTAIIDGSFGDLTISNLSTSFKTINLILENSDALINLPKNIDYNLYFKGNRSKYNNKSTTQKTVSNYPEGESSNRTISVNAKFSNVIMN